jgi:hypothetical protein
MSSTAAKLETAVVTKDELTELANWERKHAKANKEKSAAEKQVKFLRLQLAEKVLGVKTEDEFKALTPEQVTKKLNKRLESGEWKAERGAPEFSFVNTSHGRYPAWAQLYASKLGETAAKLITAETPETYSYAVAVSAL